jgi:DNA-binding MarR family transcriptional regulator
MKMKPQNIRTLKLLEELERNQSPSQRYLAKKLNVSLGLVNSFVRRLAQKGYFKVTTIPKKRARYILTPKGMAEKTRLTYEYINYSYRFYKDACQKVANTFLQLSEQGVRRVVFFGVSPIAEIAGISIQDTAIELVALVDEAPDESVFLGQRVLSPETLHQLSFDRIVVTAMDQTQDVFKMIENMGIGRSKIVTLQ